jgi:hypothetical protein
MRPKASQEAFLAKQVLRFVILLEGCSGRFKAGHRMAGQIIREIKWRGIETEYNLK